MILKIINDGLWLWLSLGLAGYILMFMFEMRAAAKVNEATHGFKPLRQTHKGIWASILTLFFMALFTISLFIRFGYFLF
jgi:hypothetical protein